MNDNEVIEGIQYCYGSNAGSCIECPRFMHKDGCVSMHDAIGIINRQKAEIETLKTENTQLHFDINNYKDFIEYIILNCKAKEMEE